MYEMSRVSIVRTCSECGCEVPANDVAWISRASVILLGVVDILCGECFDDMTITNDQRIVDKRARLLAREERQRRYGMKRL